MSGEDDDFLAGESVFGLREALVGDDFAESLRGGVGGWGEVRHGFVELLGEGGFSVVLKVVSGEEGGGVGGVLTKGEEA